MSKYSKTLLGVVTIIGLTVSTYTFADSIHSVLKNGQVSKEMVVKEGIYRYKSNPQYIEDYVNNSRAIIEGKFTVDTESMAGMNEHSAHDWCEVLGRARPDCS